MAAWKQAPLAFAPGDPREVLIADVYELTDQLGTVGIYRLTLITGRTLTVFDHDPARMRALLTARTTALREAARDPEARVPHLLWSEELSHFYVMTGRSTYTLSLTPIALLDRRQPCRTNGQLRPARRL